MVTGDAPVRIESGTKQDITLAGVAYELTLFEATSEDGAGAPTDSPCADFYGYRSMVWLDANILPKAAPKQDAGTP
jgi:hypothetical protein